MIEILKTRLHALVNDSMETNRNKQERDALGCTKLLKNLIAIHFYFQKKCIYREQHIVITKKLTLSFEIVIHFEVSRFHLR